MELLQQIDMIIFFIIASYILGIWTWILLYKKTKWIEFILVIVSVMWIISHIYGMISSVSIDLVFNLVGAWVVAEIAGIRSAKKLRELVEKGSDLRDTIWTIKWKK